MIEEMENIALEANAMEIARTLTHLPVEKIEAAIKARQANDGAVRGALPASAKLVSQKTVASLQILLFAIGELKKTLPTDQELASGTSDMLDSMQALFGKAKP